jgi:hypothetical protein
MRGETKHSDDGEPSTVAAGRRLAAATVVGPVRQVVRTASNGVATIDRASLTRLQLDENGRTIRPGLRSNGRV